MKKTNRIFSILLALAMMVCMLPLSDMTAFAASITVNVKTVSNGMFSLEVEPADSIENVKQKIQDKKGFKPSKMILYYGQTLLQDGRTMADYNIKSGDTLDLELTKVYLAVGDSISTGYGLDDANTKAFPALVGATLGADYTVVNKAVNGETTASLIENLKKTDYQTAVANADIITLTVGGNDMMDILYQFMAVKMNFELDEVKAAFASMDMEVLNAAATILNGGGFDPDESEYESVVTDIKGAIATIRALNSDAVLIVNTQYNPYTELAAQIREIAVFLAFINPELAALANAILALEAEVQVALGILNSGIIDGAGTSYTVADVHTAFDTARAEDDTLTLCNAKLDTTAMSVNMDFHPNANGHEVIAETVKLLLPAVNHSHCVCGGNTDIGDHTAHPDVEFTPWTSTNSMPTEPGNYVLTNDVTIADTWKPKDGTILCLNGHTLSAPVVDVVQNYKFTLCDCGDGKITTGESTSAEVVFLYADSTFNMYGGKISSGNDRRGVYVANAWFNMYGGCITDNATEETGAGVYLYGVAKMTMYGGSITNNTSKETGGGVHNEGIFIMTGGEISGNSSINSTGGGVWSATEAPISISGNAVITGNTGKEGTNNLHLASNGTIDAKITVGELGSNASVGVSVDNNHGMILSDGGKDYADKFSSDNGAYAVAVEGNNLKLVEAAGVQVGQVTLKNGEYTTDGQSTTTTKPESGGYAYFKDGVLTLNNFTYSGGGDYLSAIYCNYALTIKVEGENSITRKVVAGEDTDNEMVLRGIWVRSGELKIIGDDKEDFLEVIVNGHDNTAAYAVNGNSEGVVIENCTLEAKSATGGAGLYVAGDVSITGAEVLGSSGIADDYRDTFGIYAATLKVKDSDVVAVAEDNSNDGANGLWIAGSTGKLIFESGSIVAETSDVSDDSYAVNIASEDVTLPAEYWMRTSASASFAEGTWDGANIGPYIELTTTLQSGSITNISEMDKVYDGSAVEAPTVSALSTGGKTFKYKVKGADDSTYTTDAPTNAGEYTCLIAVAADDNYTEATATKDFIISKALLTVTANSHQITYGDEPVGNGVDITGFAPGEDENYLGGELNYDFTYIRYEDIGDNYEIRPKGYESDNYDFIYVPGTLKVVAADQSAPTTPAGVNTTFINTADGKITGVTSEMEYRKDGDTNYTAVTGTEITGLAAGTYYVRFAANVNYNASPEIRIVIALGDKRTPSIDTDPTASRVIIGGKLSDSTLTGGVASVDGEFTWVNPDAVMNNAGKFDMLVRFTPTDTATYNTVDFEIEVEVVVCDTASGEHDFTEQMNNADEHWTVCAKCKTEETDSREAHKGGTATCTAKAECSVCGEAYGAEPSHGETEIRNAKLTSCDEEGYTGDTHCKVCGEKLESGTAIAKTAHNYENGKCTVCDASDPNYAPDSPQTGDSGVMHLWIIMAVSALGIVVVLGFSKKRKAF